MMSTQEVRQRFLEAFEQWHHTRVPSSAVVPHEDPTLLFTNAGMNQFKDVFLGTARRDYKRAVTSQKCIRVGGKHNDLDNVGHTSRHLTFFEMLGNFSFGDYFKEEAIAFAWKVCTEVFGFAPERLWATVFHTDEEAFLLWQKWLPKERIVRFGEAENFWSMGDTGPCGPCSELLYDRGENFGSATHPYDDPSGERFLEFWNLVFMSFDRDAAGELTPLPHPAVDTGAGLERVMLLIQGERNVFHTDLLRALIGAVEARCGIPYVPGSAQAPAFCVIADHLRMLAFAIADGAQPSNTDRGYVLRKIVRRAVRYGRQLGLDQPFLGDLLPVLVARMGQHYPELIEAEERIAAILRLEEESFLKTLHRGGALLQQVMERACDGTGCISGEDAFRLKDTYGFPIEEIRLLAKDAGLQVDEEGFAVLDQAARERSRQAQKTVSQRPQDSLLRELSSQLPPTHFVGYQALQCTSTVLALLRHGELVQELQEGDLGEVVLDRTPFYAEMGGQVGDTGWLDHDHHLPVLDTQQLFTGLYGHRVRVERGSLRVGDVVAPHVDSERRARIAANHTATHLLHWALCERLGDHVRQAGSYVDGERLRFDFSYHQGLTQEDLRILEDRVNGAIRKASAVEVYEAPYVEVQNDRAIKQFFGDKYGTQVRVVDMGVSKELCGGTHVDSVGVLGLVKIIKESSIGAGIRRLEAVTGEAALAAFREAEDHLHLLCGLLKTEPHLLTERLHKVLDAHKEAERQLHAFELEQRQTLAATLSQQAVDCGSYKLLCAQVEISPETLKELAELIAGQLGAAVVALGVVTAERVQLVVRSTIPEKQPAHLLAKGVAGQLGGGAGGHAQCAQAGGKKPEQLPGVLAELQKRVLTAAIPG